MASSRQVTADLVLEAQAGHSGAMESLLRASYPKLMRSASFLIRDYDAAQDVVQETLLKLALNVRQVYRPAAFQSWAHTILQREIAGFIKRRRKEITAAVSYDDANLELQPRAHDAPPFAPTAEMEECLGQLQSEDRRLLDLHYWCGLELGEIAPMLGIAAGAAKTRLFRARRRLGSLLSEPEWSLATSGT